MKGHIYSLNTLGRNYARHVKQSRKGENTGQEMDSGFKATMFIMLVNPQLLSVATGLAATPVPMDFAEQPLIFGA